MKILFVSPTWTEDLGIFAKIAKKRNSQPPLGILYLASVAEKRGHKVRFIDADVEDYNTKSLVDTVIRHNFDLVGITATSPIFHKAVILAKEIKAKGFKSPVLIGGEHINIFKKEAFFDCFDYGFFGESDNSFNYFLNIIENKLDNYDSIKGFIYRENGKIIETEPANRINSLDELQFPAMHLINHKKYVMTFAKFKSRNYLPIMATRGCPFKCVFCSEPLTNPSIRFRSPRNIVDEIEQWLDLLGISHFFFMDSNLTLKQEQIKGVCDEILGRNIKITFEGWTRANLVDKKILELMKKAGLIRISYGIESGDPKILKIIRKDVTHEAMLDAFKITEELGIEPACSVMLGLPGETKKSVEKTIRFVKSIPQVLYSNFSIANPYPGSVMYDWAVSGKHGMRLSINDFSEYRRYDSSPISVNDLTSRDLISLQKIGLLRIHLTPRRIFTVIKMLGLIEMLNLFLKFIFKGCLSILRVKNDQL
ncbi:MAG: radical SAM protein [Candidatus Omnitrophota bacterium]